MPTGNATLMPAMEIAAASKVLPFFRPITIRTSRNCLAPLSSTTPKSTEIKAQLQTHHFSDNSVRHFDRTYQNEHVVHQFANVVPDHLKPITAKLRECGVMAYPLDYMSPKIPGLGDVNWGAFISALNDIRFNGCAVIEVEDKAFEGSKEDILNSIRLSKRYLDNYLI